MPFIRGKTGQRGRQVWRADCRHCQALEEYQAAVDARERLRESGDTVPAHVPGSSGANLGYYQLSDEEFNALHPPVLFRDFLLDFKERYESERELYEFAQDLGSSER